MATKTQAYVAMMKLPHAAAALAAVEKWRERQRRAKKGLFSVKITAAAMLEIVELAPYADQDALLQFLADGGPNTNIVFCMMYSGALLKAQDAELAALQRSGRAGA